ncbi:MAG: L-threonylcarbamoyladenylate synthase [Bdellovibrionales bacterium]
MMNLAHTSFMFVQKDLEHIVRYLNEGKIIAYPTETLWGLGVDISNPEAVDSLFKLKERPNNKPVSVLVADKRMALEHAYLDESDEQLIDLFWPGPLTLVLPIKETIPPKIHAYSNMVGLRCSSHPFVRSVLRKFKKPISTTSANRSGHPPAHSKRDLIWCPDSVIVVDDDTKCIKNPGSTVLQKVKDGYEIIREGQIEAKMLQQFVNIKNMAEFY